MTVCLQDPSACPELAVDTPLGVWMPQLKRMFADLRNSIEACEEMVCRQVIRCSESTEKINKDVQDMLSTLMSCKAEVEKLEGIEKRMSRLEERTEESDIIEGDLRNHTASQEEVNAEMKEQISILEDKLADQQVHISTLEQKASQQESQIENLQRTIESLQRDLQDMVEDRKRLWSVSSGYQSSRSTSDVSVNQATETAARTAANKVKKLKQRKVEDLDEAHFLSSEEES